MARSGYWKFHRKMWDWPWANNANYFVVWCWLLSEAQFQDGKSVLFHGKRINLKPGQLTCGAYQIADATGVSRGTVERVINTLKNEEQVRKETDYQCSMITIVRWSEYQGDERKSGERVRRDRGTSEEGVRTTEEGNNTRMKEGKKGIVPTGPTPGETTTRFFSEVESREPVIAFFVKKGIPEKLVRDEITKFVLYWTEPNASGTKVLWQKRETFDVRRRLVTWFLKFDKRMTPTGNNKINHLPKVVKI